MDNSRQVKTTGRARERRRVISDEAMRRFLLGVVLSLVFLSGQSEGRAQQSSLAWKDETKQVLPTSDADQESSTVPFTGSSSGVTSINSYLADLLRESGSDFSKKLSSLQESVRTILEKHILSSVGWTSAISSTADAVLRELQVAEADDEVSAGATGSTPHKAEEVWTSKKVRKLSSVKTTKAQKTTKPQPQQKKTKPALGFLPTVGMALGGIGACLCLILCCCWCARPRGQYEVSISAKQVRQGADSQAPQFTIPAFNIGPHSKRVRPLYGGGLDTFSDISLSTPATPKTDLWSTRGPGPSKTPGWFPFKPSNSFGLEADSGRTPAPPVHMFSYRDLQKATRNFTMHIGKGAFGSVHKAVLRDGSEAAVKVLDKYEVEGEHEFQKEVLMLGRLQHPHLVHMRGFCAERYHKILVYAYMPQGTLRSHLAADYPIPLKWEDRLRIIKEVASAFFYLHDQVMPPVLHRNIKSENVLLDDDMTAKVSDFGLSLTKADHIRVLNHRKTGGSSYLEPDFLTTGVYSEQSEMYSFAILVFGILSGRTPEQGLLEYVALASADGEGLENWDILVDPRIEEHYNPDEFAYVASIASRCMARVPSRRPKMGDVLEALALTDQMAASAGTLQVDRPIKGLRAPAEGADTLSESTPDNGGGSMDTSGVARTFSFGVYHTASLDLSPCETEVGNVDSSRDTRGTAPMVQMSSEGLNPFRSGTLQAYSLVDAEMADPNGSHLRR